MNKYSLTSKQRPGYIWDPSRVVQYESLFSILSKFSQQNFANSEDIWRSFGKKYISKNGKKFCRPRVNLNYEDKLDSILLKDQLDIDESTYEFSKVFPYIPPIVFCETQRRNTNIPIFRKAIEDELRYCPICLSNQFHTPLFQAKWVYSCPVHKVALQTHCLHCGRSKPYMLVGSAFNVPFGCECNIHLSNIELTSEEYHEKTREVRRCIHQYLDWIDKITSKYEMLYMGISSSKHMLSTLHDSYHYLTEYWAKVQPPDEPILSMLYPENTLGESYSRRHEGGSYLEASCEVTARPFWEHSNAHHNIAEAEWMIPLITELHDKLEAEKNVIQSKYLSHHEKCIKNIQRAISEKGLVNYSFICPYAFSYILWEMYWKNEHADIISPNRTKLDFVGHLHFELLHTNFYHFNYILRKNSEKVPDLNSHWIISNMLELYLLSSFEMSLDYALRTKDSEPGHLISPDFITTDNNPYFYLEQDNEQRCFKFIAWRDHIESKLNEKVACGCNTEHENHVSQCVSALLSMPVVQKIKGIYALTQCCHDIANNEHRS